MKEVAKQTSKRDHSGQKTIQTKTWLEDTWNAQWQQEDRHGWSRVRRGAGRPAEETGTHIGPYIFQRVTQAALSRGAKMEAGRL